MTQGGGGNQGIVRADGRARSFQVGTNASGMHSTFVIKRQPLHRAQELLQCGQARRGCGFGQARKPVAQFVFHDSRHPYIGGAG